MLIAFVLVIGLLAIFKHAIVRYATHRALAAVPGWKAEAGDANLSLFPLMYSVTDVNMVPDDETLPIFYVGDLQTGLFWKDLIRGRVNAWCNIDRAKMTFFLIKITIPDIAEILQNLLPFQVQRVQLKQGEITIVFRHTRHQDLKHPEGDGPQIWFHDIEASMEGIASRVGLEKQVTTLALRSKLQRSGELNVFVTADLLATDQLSFTGQMELRGLHLSDIDRELKPIGLKVDGTFDMLARFGVDHGNLKGAVQPFIKNGHVEAVQEDLLSKLKALLADAAIDILSDRVPERNAVATVVPIHGKLLHPKADLWTTVWGVLRNAFVEGLIESIRMLPPPTAPGTAENSPPPPTAKK